MKSKSTDSFTEFFKAVRESCSSTLWSKAVELARTGTFAATRNADAITINIIDKSESVRPVVTLYEEDLDWQCTCSSDEDPCRHVAASSIAIRRSRERGEDLPQASEDTGRLYYEFGSTGDELSLIRVIRTSENKTPLTTTLSAITTGRVQGPSVITTPADLEIDVLLGSANAPLTAAKASPLIKALLSGNCQIEIDGVAAKADANACGVEITVEDDGPGIKVRAGVGTGKNQFYRNGYAISKDGDSKVLRPAILPESSPFMAELLKDGRFYGRQEFGTFVSEVLPRLKDRYTVHIRTNKLPSVGYSKPRLEVDARDLFPHGISVKAAIVYGDPVDTRISDGQVSHFGNHISTRSVDDERQLKDDLWRQLKLELGPAITLNPDDAFTFLAKLGSFRGDVIGDAPAKWKMKGRLTPTLSWTDEFPTASFHAASGGSGDTASSDSVLDAWSRGESLVRLDGGGFASLPVAWLEDHADILAAMSSAKEHRELGPAALNALAQTASHLGITLPRSVADMRERFKKLLSRSDITRPRLHAELRPYQEDGITWLVNLTESGQGAILADDMGLGKTLQAIATLKKPSLVIAPTSVLVNWKREIERFRPELKACVFHGAQRNLDPNADVIITSYNLARICEDQLKAFTWNVVVADEAQTLKNPDSQIFASACRISARARIALTGTPIENRLSDLWAQMEFCNPGLLGSRKYFADVVARRIGKGSSDALASLRQRIKPYFLRRLKTEVAKDLPPRTQIVRRISLSPAEQGIYQNILSATKADVQNAASADGSINSIKVLELLLRLRQACCHPDLLPGMSGQQSAKVEYAVDMMKTLTEEGHRVLVFSQWTSYLDLIANELEKQNIQMLRIDGSTQNRQSVVDRFQSPEGEPVLLMSLKAGGTGLNLTAADHVLIMDPWWNPAAEEQALSRAWRIGQDKPVFVHKLVAAGTIEDSILQLQEAKQHLSDQVTGGDYADAPDLKDILALLAEEHVTADE